MERGSPKLLPVSADAPIVPKSDSAPEPFKPSAPTTRATSTPIRTILVDLDDTLADTTHRHPLALEARKLDGAAVGPAWERYSLACLEDAPIEFTIRLVYAWASNYDIHLVTGRNVIAHDLTEQWLETHGVPWNTLTMRRPDNHASNANFKRDVAKKAIAGGAKIEWAMDDNEGVVPVYAKLGIATLVVQRPEAPWSWGEAPKAY